MVYLRKRLTLKPEGAAQLHVHSQACGVDESQWEEKGLPYHATLEAFSADLVIENEMLDGEQSAILWQW